MDFEIAQLTQALSQILSPVLPHLLDAGKKAAEGAGKKVASEAIEKASTLWTRLGSEVEARPAAAEAATDLAKSPDDADAQAAFRQQLKKILLADEDLARTLADLLEEGGGSAPGVVVHGNGVVAHGPGAVAGGQVGISGDVHGDVVVGNRRPE